jgi:mono/diheme cytochrome c family protein
MRHTLSALLVGGALVACGTTTSNVSRVAGDSELAAAAKDVLQRNCVTCHGAPGTQVGQNNLFAEVTDLAKLVSSNRVKPGQPDLSKLYRRMTNAVAPMPPKVHPVTGAEIARPAQADIDAIKAWIAAGAPAN